MDLLIEIIDRIRKAKRPVFNAGNGIRIGNAHKEFMELAELLNIPVVVGWNSEDCIEVDHPLYAGRPGKSLPYILIYLFMQTVRYLCDSL